MSAHAIAHTFIFIHRERLNELRFIYLFLIKFIAGDANKLLTANFAQLNYYWNKKTSVVVDVVEMTTA